MTKIKLILLITIWIVLAIIFVCNTNFSTILKKTPDEKSKSQTWYSLDVSGFHGVVAGDNVLVIEKAFIRNDGENNFWRGDGDIGCHIYFYSNGEWTLYKNLRLFGPHYHGIEQDGSEKYEWSDNLGVIYENYGIIQWRDFRCDSMRIKLVEGDHGLTKNDIVFEEIVESAKLKNYQLVRIDGDTVNNEATLWFRTYRILPVKE